MINGNKKAMIPTTTPIIPHKSAFLAVTSSAGSPWAFKKKNPATINIITAKAINSTHSKPIIPVIIFNNHGVPAFKFGTGLAPASKGAAKVMVGSNSKTLIEMVEIIFLIIHFLINRATY